MVMCFNRFDSQAVSKLQQAITLNPKKHDALWCLGNALTSQGFLYADSTRANDFFDKARDCFQRALDEEPRNETYKKALEMTHKAPYLHQVKNDLSYFMDAIAFTDGHQHSMLVKQQNCGNALSHRTILRTNSRFRAILEVGLQMTQPVLFACECALCCCSSEHIS